MPPLLAVLFELALVAALATAAVFSRRLCFGGAQGSNVVDGEPRRAVPWDGNFVFYAALAYLFLQMVGGEVASQWFVHGLAPEARAELDVRNVPLVDLYPEFFVDLLRCSAVVGWSTMFVVAVLLNVYAGATLDDLGLGVRRLRSDLLLAMGTFPLIVAPVLLLNLAITQVLGESQHPILLAYKKNPGPDLLFWIAVAAVGTAPVVEEFLFRGVFQGWLERVFDPPPSVTSSPSTTPSSDGAMETDTRTMPATSRRRSVPIVASAALFALAHLGNGPDPIPLFFFGLGLGYLYRRTHRIWPGVVVHMLLNALSLGILFLAVERPAIG